MTPYFAKPENLEKLKIIVTGWLGVPYRHMGATRGGVDCTKFIGLVCRDLTILQEVEADYYPKDWHIHGVVEVVLNSFKRHESLLAPGLSLQTLAPDGEPMPGDIILIATNQRGLCNHCGIYLGNDKMAHCLARKGVHLADYTFSFRSRTKYFLRLYEA